MNEEKTIKEYAKSLSLISKTLLNCSFYNKKKELITICKELQKANREFIKILEFNEVNKLDKKYLA